MNTVNTDIAPSWFPSETPEERVYWRSGLECVKPLHEYNQYAVIYSSVHAAWAARERIQLKHPGKYRPIIQPESISRREAEAKAVSLGINIIKVLDEQGNIVEEWTV